jgi:nitrogen-specific signal transduction histidine kinase
VPVVFDGADAALAVARDLTERQEILARLAQTDRLVSIGTLAAGIAHEINNPLAYVLGSLELAQRALSSPIRSVEVLSNHLARARDGAERVLSIARDLRIFARGQGDDASIVAVAPLIQSAVDMVRHDLESRARVELRLADVPPVRASEAQLGQVMLNLVVNAAQAIVPGDPQRNLVRIELSEESDLAIRIDVTDSGAGIAPEVLPRVFEPFFTTKPVGVGTGLGLAICHGSVTAMGGRISVKSELGRGTTFSVRLPHLGRLVEAELPGNAQSRRSATVPKLGRLLIIDDEPRLARTLAELLAEEFEVMIATSGEQADTLLTNHAFDVVLCDVCMPGASGIDLHRRLLATQPAVASRFVLMTGAILPAARDYADKHQVPWVEKPVDYPRLVELLRAIARRSIN